MIEAWKKLRRKLEESPVDVFLTGVGMIATAVAYMPDVAAREMVAALHMWADTYLSRHKE